MNKPLLSIGIIFKNDISCLARCLESLTPLRAAIPCQLVMADTGSADGSRAVAEQYADILLVSHGSMILPPPATLCWTAVRENGVSR